MVFKIYFILEGHSLWDVSFLARIEPRPSAVKTRVLATGPLGILCSVFDCDVQTRSVCSCCICVLLHPMPHLASFPWVPYIQAQQDKDQGDHLSPVQLLSEEQPACILEGRWASDSDLPNFSKDTSFPIAMLIPKLAPSSLTVII